ncbi:MAG: formylmethanofuran--tetrahydromethanopterin N-formyltransferase [Methanobacteriota archaeon]
MIVDDTYAEAFGSVFSRILVTAKNDVWLNQAVNSATGYATSTISCDCEAGLDSYVEASKTSDGRVGAILQFHVPKFRKDAVKLLEWALIHRISQSILTCPTTRVFNALDTGESLPVGYKLGFFGDGFQSEKDDFDRTMTEIPIMSGTFQIEKNLSYGEGVMGGNLWLMGDSGESALSAVEAAVVAVKKIGGVITPFPGGVCSSGSKVRSMNYDFLIASTNHEFCPTLKDVVESKLSEEIESVYEIIIDGVSLEKVSEATAASLKAVSKTPGLVRVSAGNYGGKLGKYKIPLRL